MGNLFDERRKKAIQQGLKAGKLDISGKKPLEQGLAGEPDHAPPRPEGPNQSEEPREALIPKGPLVRHSDHVLIDGGPSGSSKLQKPYPRNFTKRDLQYEFLGAIRDHDLDRVRVAITYGANVNEPYDVTLVGKKKWWGGQSKTSMRMTPLKIAMQLGFDDVAKLLRQNGARE